MLVKVCGITQKDQAQNIHESGADLIGHIFYEKSQRFLSKAVEVDGMQRVGVFVNDSFSKIVDTCREHQLQWVQLHGNESPELCRHLKNKGYKVIKAIPVNSKIPKNHVNYKEVVDFILFDTASVNHGGTGKKFDWTIFHHENIETPFMLSGGISETDVDEIRSIRELQKNLIGVDINSRFEISPGIKNLDMVKTFIQKIKQYD